MPARIQAQICPHGSARSPLYVVSDRVSGAIRKRNRGSEWLAFLRGFVASVFAGAALLASVFVAFRAAVAFRFAFLQRRFDGLDDFRCDLALAHIKARDNYEI